MRYSKRITTLSPAGAPWAVLVSTLLVSTLLVSTVLLLVSTAAAQEGSPYRIGPGDEIEVRVAELPDIDRDFTVAADGTVELPHAGSVAAEGRTEGQLAAEIRSRLESSGLRRATVSVAVRRPSRPIAVLGAVMQPGNLPVLGRATVLDALLEAGGLSADRGSSILVRRRASNGLADQVEISVEDLFELADPAVNLPVFPGDVIRVPKAPTIRISFLGEVNQAGSHSYTGNARVTLLAAIAQAGGLSETASPKVRILRGQGDQKVELAANYRRILNGKDPDVELQDGDIIVVRESFF